MTRGARAAWIVAVVDIVVFIATMALTPSDLTGIAAVAVFALYAAGISAFALVGALLITRVPGNRIGTLLFAAGTLLVLATVIGGYAEAGDAATPPWPLAGAARTVGDILFLYPIFIALTWVPLYFPDGRLPTPRFRWVARLNAANMAVWTIDSVVTALIAGGVTPGLAGLAPMHDVAQVFVFAASVASFVGAVLAIRLRFVRGGPIQRQQVKWLLAVVVTGLVFWSLSFAVPDPQLHDTLSGFGVITMLALPVVIGLAILRYRLFELDRIISRTLSYGLVSVVLLAVYGAAVILLSTAFEAFTQGQTIAVAASTLVAFAAFQPVRRWAQRIVDRRFDRARYDGTRTAQAFAERLRDEVDMEAVRRDLAGTTASALAPASLTVWLRPQGGPR